MEDDYTKAIRDAATRRQAKIAAVTAKEKKETSATQEKFETQSRILNTKLLPRLRKLKSQFEAPDNGPKDAKTKPYIPLEIKENPSTATSGPSVSIVAFVVLDKQNVRHHTQSITFTIVEGNKIAARPSAMPKHADDAEEFEDMKLPAENVGQIVYKIASVITDQHVTIMAALKKKCLLKSS